MEKKNLSRKQELEDQLESLTLEHEEAYTSYKKARKEYDDFLKLPITESNKETDKYAILSEARHKTFNRQIKFEDEIRWIKRELETKYMQ
jgi:tRNA(Ser,Leu) C12 N-acetylase TAN1